MKSSNFQDFPDDILLPAWTIVKLEHFNKNSRGAKCRGSKRIIVLNEDNIHPLFCEVRCPRDY